jgi:methyltransferase family protein
MPARVMRVTGPRRTRLFATCVPGLGRMVRRQLETMNGTLITGTGSDERVDIVFFEAERASRAGVLRSRLAEEVFAEIGRASRAGGAGAVAVAARAWHHPDSVQRALSVWADEVRPLSSSMTFRVTVHLRSEARFRRADLRRALADMVARDKPRWRFSDPAQLEISIVEFHDGQYVAGLRLGGAAGRLPHHDDARVAALPVTVAAAMVDLAGAPGASGGGRATLLDPCCGAGAILAEALAAGWAAEGTDIANAAVAAAARAAPGAGVQLGDARDLLLPDNYAGALVSWLPSAHFQAPGAWEQWCLLALAEMSRVTRSGGALVLLAPALSRSAIPTALRLRRQVPVRLPATTETIWVFGRS